MEGNGHDVIVVLFYMLAGVRKTTKDISQDSQVLSVTTNLSVSDSISR
jgi:hypothetical protein